MDSTFRPSVPTQEGGCIGVFSDNRLGRDRRQKDTKFKKEEEGTTEMETNRRPSDFPEARRPEVR